MSATLGLLSYWQVPLKEQLSDGDFGATPTLFSGTVSQGGALRSLLGVANKNGLYYVFNTAKLGAGPVKQIRVAVGGNDPETGGGSISPSSWDGTQIYVAGGTTTIGGTTYQGSLRAFNPNKLGPGPVWAIGFSGGPVLGAVATDPELVAVGAGGFSMVVNSANEDGALHGCGERLLRRAVDRLRGHLRGRHVTGRGIARLQREWTVGLLPRAITTIKGRSGR